MIAPAAFWVAVLGLGVSSAAIAGLDAMARAAKVVLKNRGRVFFTAGLIRSILSGCLFISSLDFHLSERPRGRQGNTPVLRCTVANACDRSIPSVSVNRWHRSSPYTAFTVEHTRDVELGHLVKL